MPLDFPWPGSATVAFFEAFQLPDWSEPQPPTPCLYTLLPTFPRGVQKTEKKDIQGLSIFYFSRWRKNSFTKHQPWKDIFLFLIHSINYIPISLLIYPKSKKKMFFIIPLLNFIQYIRVILKAVKNSIKLTKLDVWKC